MSQQAVPKLAKLPSSPGRDIPARIEIVDGVPVFRADESVSQRIRHLLEKERTRGLTAEEREELDFYEALDDYLSLLNRLARNTFIYPAN